MGRRVSILHFKMALASDFSGWTEDIEERFFTRLRLKNGTFKTTSTARLNDVNAEIATLLKDRPAIECMDVAVSSGITTLEWMRDLNSLNLQYNMTATDLCFSAQIFSFGSLFRVLETKKGYPLQFEIGPFVIPNWHRRLGYLRGDWLLLQIVRPFFSLLRSLSRRPQVEEVPLVSPRLLLSKEIKPPELLEVDLFESPKAEMLSHFDVIRASNILNLQYFDRKSLKKAVENLALQLKVGGILAVTRTDEKNLNHATFFKKESESKLVSVFRLGDGSEIEPLVSSLKL